MRSTSLSFVTRLSMAAAAAAVVMTAVVAWNMAQHAVASDGKASPPVPVAATPAPVPPRQGPVTLAAAQPAPPVFPPPRNLSGPES